MRFSANLGFLWKDRSLPEAIRAAKMAGFDAVECHWPYDVPAAEVAAALGETGLEMLGLNTSRGDVASGENGLSALPGRETDARAAIDEAISYASTIGAANIHVMAGFASGEEAHRCFLANLGYACKAALPHGITILIEPLNHYDAPGYFLSTTEQACMIMEELGAPNLKLMFDCYHVQLMEGNLTNRLKRLLPVTGHVQFASVPDRGPPDGGEVSYSYIFGLLEELGYDAPLGAEYKPVGSTENSLGWMARQLRDA
ncbi:hydroxypyruvate isomerase family protein [Nitratireductor basaltis]|uniref:Hydroxypyruvate isomerase n=1 Tax=Nitratireductor basaltis TaxID=472175 RepID=A0A084U6I3_9HYPH|nr:TIM barrel protein [Nitratireductor basaltis]KFB08569.1 Hydroxypyruvate isomerase [Nitratireductor basaltis]